MAKFLTLADLPAADQNEVARIQAIPSAQRTTKEAAYLTSRAAYIGNTILKTDASGNILGASGPAVPADGTTGFAKGAGFINTAASDGSNANYQNEGSPSACQFVAGGGGGGSPYPNSDTASVLLSGNVNGVTIDGSGIAVVPVTFSFAANPSDPNEDSLAIPPANLGLTYVLDSATPDLTATEDGIWAIGVQFETTLNQDSPGTIASIQINDPTDYIGVDSGSCDTLTPFNTWLWATAIAHVKAGGVLNATGIIRNAATGTANFSFEVQIARLK